MNIFCKSGANAARIAGKDKAESGSMADYGTLKNPGCPEILKNTT